MRNDFARVPRQINQQVEFLGRELYFVAANENRVSILVNPEMAIFDCATLDRFLR